MVPTMLAIRKIARGQGNIVVQEIPAPVPGPGQVLVAVKCAGICGTDLHIYLDEFETIPPVTIGHELAGEIAEIGPDVTGWQVGERVTTETYFYTCGHCQYCRDGRRNLCLQRRSIGSKQDGAFAEFLVTPASNLFRIPDDVALESAALTEPVACVVHGLIQTAGVNSGDNVAITGPGPIGLLAMQLAKLAGAKVIMIGTGPDAGRLQLAKELGADEALNVDQAGSVPETATQIFHGAGADLVVECSGAAQAAKMLVDIAKRGARYCQLGLYGKPILFDQDAVCYKELIVTGSNASVTSAWRRALRLLAEKRIDTKRLITHRFSLTDWDCALDVTRRKEGVKVVLVPGPSSSPGVNSN